MQIATGNRLKEARETMGLSLRAFAEPLGITHTTVGHWENSKGEIPFSSALGIEKIHGISSDWLLMGKGSMFVAKADDGLVVVPLLSATPYDGEGGSLRDFVSSQRMTFSEDWLGGLAGTHFENMCLIRVEGDSMAPALYDRDLVFAVGLVAKPDYRDGVWVVRMGERLVIKRVQLLPNGKFQVSCDNPAYRSMELKDPGALLGYVVGGPPRRF